MTATNVSEGISQGLPRGLKTAQAAIQSPEVQEMLMRLSKYNLGIFMPHKHDEHTGAFELLPDEIMQVESGVEVSFQPTKDIANQTMRFLPVGWCWRAGAATPVAACEIVCQDGQGEVRHQTKHKPGGR